MLFNSYIFILVFLPVTWLLFQQFIRRGSTNLALWVLVVASLTYYGWWDPRNLVLLGVMLAVDMAVVQLMAWTKTRLNFLRHVFFGLGVAANVAVLGYYKYVNFIVDNINELGGLNISWTTVILPIGISFFTFQKIAFLADFYDGKIERFNVRDYILFISFFPQLVAGPIVHHKEMMPQFDVLKPVTPRELQMGITYFAFGLVKKVVLADTAAARASPIFNAASFGNAPDQLTALGAVLNYTAQIYFDFSAYSDMAVGLGLLFGIRLPINFFSPYRSANIIEFWRRWHITLSHFLRDYLYIPLGGNRKGVFRRYFNLLLTMFLGGLWHGAGWTFIVWGVLHGIYLAVNHAWRELLKRIPSRKILDHALFSTGGMLLTFAAVVVGWVFFRSADMTTAMDMFRALAGAYGTGSWGWSNGMSAGMKSLITAGGLLSIAWFLPNTHQLMHYQGTQAPMGPDAPASISWRPNVIWAVIIGIMLATSLSLLSKISEFIYFQF